MGEYVRVGQVAEALGRSAYQIRKLCDSGVIASIVIEGQRQIPLAELQRVLKDGTPLIPRIIDDQQLRRRNRTHRPKRVRTRNHHQLRIPPSDAVVWSDEEVEITENRARTKEAQIREALADLKLLETKNEIAERHAQREAERAQRQAKEAALRNRREWTERWLRHGLKMIPAGVAEKLAVDVYSQIKHRLTRFGPEDAEVIVQSAVETAVRDVLQPVYDLLEQLQEASEALSIALEKLPPEMKADNSSFAMALSAACGGGNSRAESEWEVLASKAGSTDLAIAIEAAGGVPVPFERMVAIANAAIERVIDDYCRKGRP